MTRADQIEIWKPVQGFPGCDSAYVVSNLGRVQRVSTGRMMARSLNGRGYLRVTLTALPHFRSNSVPVHHIVAYAFLGERPVGMHINHIDGDKLNNAASNLEYCTPAQNLDHARKLGLLIQAGEGCGRAKLTNSGVAEIRSRLLRGERGASLAREFKVSRSSISEIRTGSTWKTLV